MDLNAPPRSGMSPRALMRCCMGAGPPTPQHHMHGFRFQSDCLLGRSTGYNLHPTWGQAGARSGCGAG